MRTEYGDWDEDEIECLKEGLRKFGRAWGKIYREVGGRKTATQCKQFYDTHCAIDKLGLLKALADHSSMKVCNMNYYKKKKGGYFRESGWFCPPPYPISHWFFLSLVFELSPSPKIVKVC